MWKESVCYVGLYFNKISVWYEIINYKICILFFLNMKLLIEFYNIVFYIWKLNESKL